jgi:hypothetical protein
VTHATVVRYQTRPECADDNERLIRAVFAELAEARPDGFRYASFRFDDDVSFLHVAVFDGDENPLSTLAAFGAFQSGIKDRCTDGPDPAGARVIASYRFLGDAAGDQ